MNIGLSFDPEVDRQRAIAYSNDFYEFRQRLDYTALSNLCEEMLEVLDEKVDQYSDFKINDDEYVLDRCMRFDRNNPQQLFQLSFLFGMTNFSERFHNEIITNTSGLVLASATSDDVWNDSGFNQHFICCKSGRWPREGSVYRVRYRFSGNFPSGYKAKIRSIMSEWESGTDIDFYEISSYKNFCNETRPKVAIFISSSVSSEGGSATLGAIAGNLLHWGINCGDQKYNKLRLGNGFGSVGNNANLPYYSGDGVNYERTVKVREIIDNPDEDYNHFFYSSNIIPVYDGMHMHPEVQSDGTVSMLQEEDDEFQYTAAYIHWTGQTLEYAMQVQQSKSNEGYATSPIYELPNGWITNTYDKTIDSRFSAVVRHELGHTIGLIHEHQRNDRNDTVKITCGGSAVSKLPDSEEWRLTSYDINSIMHYNGIWNCNNQIHKKSGFPISQFWSYQPPPKLNSQNGYVWTTWPPAIVSFDVSNLVMPNHFISPVDKKGVNILYP